MRNSSTRDVPPLSVHALPSERAVCSSLAFLLARGTTGRVIEHDVPRTHADHPLHAQYKGPLREALYAYAAMDREVGYSQGMSDVLAVMLFNLHDAPLASGHALIKKWNATIHI